MTRSRNKDSDLRPDIQETIERIWPADVVEMTFDSDESYFRDVETGISAAMHRLKGVRLVHERTHSGEPIWFDNSDPDEDPPDDQEFSRSYHLFFVCPDGEPFRYETSCESYDEPDWEDGDDEDDLSMETVGGTGLTGWSVAVSLLAPMAVITLSGMENFEDGSTTEPTIESPAYTESGQRVNAAVEIRKEMGEPAYQVLVKLRDRITEILQKHKIIVLPEEEWQKPVPGLRADPEVFAGHTGEPLRVLDALFFEGL